MYNPYQAPTPYGRPTGFGGYPGQPGGPSGMGGPPGMGPPGTAAPGVALPPGMQQSNASQPGRPGGLPPNFQQPPNMPNINFSAPVIRLGTSGLGKPSTPLGGSQGGRKDSSVDLMPAGGSRPGLGASHGGMEQQRQALRESMMALVPPTKEEMVRTIFVGGITEGVGGDEGVERILRTVGNLRRWNRAMDADNKACRFGFAEYDDAESLGTAVEVLRDITVPVKRQAAKGVQREKADEDENDVEVDKSKLIIIVDENSLSYLEQYQSSRGDEDPIIAQTRLDSARSALREVLHELVNPPIPYLISNGTSALDRDGDFAMQEGETRPDAPQAEVVTIPLTVDDELADIPAEMRETVAQEIAAFRDRSTRRDMERLKREEELESMERARNSGQPRPSRLASPPPTAPIGPAGGANGIPLGPRERGVQGAPVGPKGLQGQQIPRDYQKGVSFINGSGINGASASGWINREDEDSDASDEELERQRRDRKAAEQEKLYLDQERRWLNRERSRTAAVEREKARDKGEESQQEVENEAMAKRLREWNDDVEASKKVEEYYLDRSMWIRNRATFRSREAELDERDRAAEEREKARDVEKRDQARGMADQFLEKQAEEMEKTMPISREPQRFKLSLGAAAQKAQAAATSRRTVAEVEGLLEDEEEASTTTKRTLIPIKFDSAAEASGLSDEERAQAARQLAADIPSDKEGLWKWPVKWDFVDDTVLGEQLKPFVEKKIMEYLGVQEQMLVDVVEEHIRKRGQPQDLVEQLDGALDEEAEVLVKKLWRMIIFFSESEKRGLSG
ncbi:MAG: hypothetical protein M1827_003928 [Pycnora praestabilis]|nr:MAG: hypothetical protein M1827_003928 [Pycnora praestabilis]